MAQSAIGRARSGVQRAPDLLRRQRHLQPGIVALADGVDDGVDDGAGRGRRAAFTHALGADRVGLAGDGVMHDGDGRHVGGARHAVVHEAARQDLAAVVVVEHVLEQRLAEPLRDAAVDLSLENGALEDVAAVADRRVAHNLDAARLRIDLDLRDVAAVGIGRRRGHVPARVHALGDGALRDEFRGAGGDLEQGHLPAASGDDVDAPLVGHGRSVRLQQNGCGLLALLDDEIGGHGDGAADEHGRA